MSKTRLKNSGAKATTTRPATTSSSSTTTTNNKNSVPPVPTLKVVLLGDLGVGKTCLRSQFVHHVFTNAYKATIGGDYLTTTIPLPQDHQEEEDEHPPPSSESQENDNTPASSEPLIKTKPKQKITKVNLQIWDTAGQERFNSISQAFYRGTDVCILVYDITNYESVLSIRDWFSRFMEHCHVEFPGVVIVGNKSDKVNDRCVDLDEIKEIVTSNTTVANVGDYIEDWETCLREVSAKKLEVVEDLFKLVAKVGVDLLYGDDEESNELKRRRLQHFDNIDLRETHNRLNESNAANSSSCAC
ncbi:GTP-binding protein ypt71 [Candida viswanathii]|uniref:GTP-binding protein ypt71 n=1 Tax=Candida viswanathii TaxID=5486 RepID=A0A367Y407_9ASCO|nr:GTP-binding protein ypt71 [Candida viswanathii]